MDPQPQQVAVPVNRPVHGPVHGDDLRAASNPSPILTHCLMLASSWIGHLMFHNHPTPAGASQAACPHHSPEVLLVDKKFWVKFMSVFISTHTTIYQYIKQLVNYNKSIVNK